MLGTDPDADAFFEHDLMLTEPIICRALKFSGTLVAQENGRALAVQLR